MQRELYDNGDDNDNVVCAHDKAVEGALAGRKIRRQLRTTSLAENITPDMTPFYMQTTHRKSNGDLVTLSLPQPVPKAMMEEFTNPLANGAALALLITPNARLAKVTLPAAAIVQTGLVRRKLTHTASTLIEYFTALNDGRVTFSQWSMDTEGAIDILIRGFYVGPSEAEVIIGGQPVTLTITNSGWLLITGKVIGPVKVMRRGRVAECQRLLDAIANNRTGRPVNLDRFVRAYVEAQKP